MTPNTDAITILHCQSPFSSATKQFYKDSKGNIRKRSYNAGSYFKYEVRLLSTLYEWSALLHELKNKTQSFIIRGAPLEGAEEVVRRRIKGDEAGFKSQALFSVVFDMDKVPCPSHLNPQTQRDEVIQWLKNLLPVPFNQTSCVYKFSSSQGVENNDFISAHLIYRCNRRMNDLEWKRFLKLYPCPVDQALFTPVQPHFTASPLFHNMADPFPERIGYVSGITDIAAIPPLPAAPQRKPVAVSRSQVTLGREEENTALKRLLDFYPKEGGRNRFCATLAAVLYRGGWQPETIADFIFQLASAAKDEESMDRHDNALRVCNTIEEEKE